MRNRLTDERLARNAMLAMAAAGLLAAVGGYVGVGFVLFVGSLTSLPAHALRRVSAIGRRWTT